MKKFLALLLALTLVIGLFVGCGKDEPADEPNDDTTPTEEAGDETEEPTAITAQELMGNVNARKAIAIAFDKAYITDEILGNGSVPVDYFVPVGLASDQEGNDFRAAYPEGWNAYDVAKAQEYWATAKEELGFETIEISFLTYDSEGSRKISEYIQGQLETNLEGLTILLDQQPFENKLELADQGEFEFQFAGWGPDYPDPMTFLDMWVTHGGHNDAGYENPVYDENIERCKTGDLATSPDERWELLQETERILLEDDAIIVPLYSRARTIVQQPYIKDIYFHNFGGDYTFKRATTESEDGIIRFPETSDIPSMNTTVATDAVSFQAMANVLEGLVMAGKNDVVEPGVAETWEVSEDGLTYTFHLRDDAVWSNGVAITADDFVYAFHRLADPASGSQYNFMIETAAIKNGSSVITGDAPTTDLGVTAIDASTFQIELELAVPYFMKLMTFPSFYPINQEFAEAQGDAYGTSIDTVLYNGAFVLSAWEIGYEYAYAKNDAYWDAASTTCEGANFRIVKDTNTAVNLYETGEIDRVGLDADNLPAYLDDPNLFVLEETVLFYLNFNINNNGQY